MLRVRITALRRTVYHDLIELYESPETPPCEMTVGAVFVSENACRPEGFCKNAWRILEPYVLELATGGGNFFDGWMKNEKSALVSCDDGFRPLSFLIEVCD